MRQGCKLKPENCRSGIPALCDKKCYQCCGMPSVDNAHCKHSRCSYMSTHDFLSCTDGLLVMPLPSQVSIMTITGANLEAAAMWDDLIRRTLSNTAEDLEYQQVHDSLRDGRCHMGCLLMRSLLPGKTHRECHLG